jgi:protein-tyrosine phosphatase
VAYQPRTDVFRVVTVCTGNICRSPVAARLLAVGLGQRLPPAEATRVKIISAGTAAVAGAPIDRLAEHTLTARGVPLQPHRGHQLVVEDLVNSDLILTMTPSHARSCIRLDPDCAPRVHTLRGAGLLLQGQRAAGPSAGDVVARGRAVVNHLAAQKAGLPENADLEVADPVGLPLEAFERAAAVIAASLQPLIEVLAPPYH